MPRPDNTDPRRSDFAASETCRNCGKTRKSTPKMLRCSKCGQAYCSKDCQKSDWPLHKSYCQAEREVNVQQDRELHFWLRAFTSKIMEADLCCRNLCTDPDAFKKVFVLELSRTSETNPENVTKFFKVDSIVTKSVEELCRFNPSYKEYVDLSEAECRAKDCKGFFSTIVQLKDVAISAPVIHPIKNNAFVELVKMPPFSLQDWPSKITTAIDEGNADAPWVSYLFDCITEGVPYAPSPDIYEALIKKNASVTGQYLYKAETSSLYLKSRFLSTPESLRRVFRYLPARNGFREGDKNWKLVTAEHLNDCM